MIATYKTITGKYRAYVTPTVVIGSTHITRENDLRFQKSHVKYTTYENLVLQIGS